MNRKYVLKLIADERGIVSVQRLAHEFVTVLFEHRRAVLPRRGSKRRASGVREMRGFADGLKRDMEAMQAAVGTRYSNGVVERHVNRPS